MKARDYLVWRSARRYEDLSVTRWRIWNVFTLREIWRFVFCQHLLQSTEMARVSDDVLLERPAVCLYGCCSTSLQGQLNSVEVNQQEARSTIEETKLEVWLVAPKWDPLSTFGSKEEEG